MPLLALFFDLPIPLDWSVFEADFQWEGVGSSRLRRALRMWLRFYEVRFARAVKLKFEPHPFWTMEPNRVAERVGFEPTVTFLPRSISSRVPSTGLSHPSLFYLFGLCRASAIRAALARCPFGALSALTGNIHILQESRRSQGRPFPALNRRFRHFSVLRYERAKGGGRVPKECGAVEENTCNEHRPAADHQGPRSQRLPANAG